MEFNSESHSIACPKCRHGMVELTYGGIAIDRCTNCQGLWFDTGEAERLKDRWMGDALDLGKAREGKKWDPIEDIDCPSENLIVICSPRAARSRWVDQEVKKFKVLGRSTRIFCLIVDSDPCAEDTERDCFTPCLRWRYDAAGNPLEEKAEPIAADARSGGDGKALAQPLPRQ